MQTNIVAAFDSLKCVINCIKSRERYFCSRTQDFQKLSVANRNLRGDVYTLRLEKILRFDGSRRPRRGVVPKTGMEQLQYSCLLKLTDHRFEKAHFLKFWPQSVEE